MARITVTLNANEKDALRILAERERRDTRNEAAQLIRSALIQARLLPAEPDTVVDRAPKETRESNASEGGTVSSTAITSSLSLDLNGDNS
jgi:hypothetical protein